MLDFIFLKSKILLNNNIINYFIKYYYICIYYNNMSSVNIRLNNLQNEVNYIEYVIDSNVDGIGPQGIQGIPGVKGDTGLSGSNGVSLFDITLNGGATYLPNSLSSFNTNGSTGYAVTTQAYNSGCMISSYAPRTNAVYIGLTESTSIINPANPSASFSHVLYSDSTKLYRMDSGNLSSNYDVYPNSNPNYVFSVKYDNNNLYFYLDGIEAVHLRLNVGAGKTYYGCWSCYNAKTFSNIQFVPLAQGLQGPTGNTGNTGATGAKGDKGDTGSITSPVNNLVEFMDNVNITDTLNVTNQINCRAVVSSYEVAIIPPADGTTSNLILGSNNNNNYIFYQNNSGSNPNELLLQYQNNSVQPATTSTLINVLPSGNIQIGDLSSATPNVSISGSAGLGRIYDTIYNPVPTPPTQTAINVANFSANFTPSFVMDGNISNAFFKIDLSSFGLPNLDNVEMTITGMSFTGTNTGTSNAAAVLNFYLASASDVVYQSYMGSSYGISFPATSSIPSPTSFNIQYSPIILTLNTIAGVKIQNLFLICNYISPNHPSAQITPTNFTISGLVKAYMSSGNEPLTVVPL